MSDNTIDKDLYNEMRAMEKMKRDKNLSDKKLNIITGGDSVLVDFDTWWIDVNRRKPLKPWLKEIIKADFGGRGLGKSGSIEEFDDALKTFGIKF